MRSVLTIATVAVVTSFCAFGAAAQQQPNFFGNIGAAMNPAIAAQRDFERSVADYRKRLADNPTNQNPCEGLRHIMDASAQAAGRYNGSR
jgi:hypothetical protein